MPHPGRMAGSRCGGDRAEGTCPLLSLTIMVGGEAEVFERSASARRSRKGF